MLKLVSRFSRWIAVLIALCGTSAAFAQNAALQGYCTAGGAKAAVSGMSSTNFQQAIIPSCTVTVFLTGTQTKATIFSNAGGTPLANPFTANDVGSSTPGQWTFFASTTQAYDVIGSGGIAPNVYPQPAPLTTDAPPGGFLSYPGVTTDGAGGLSKEPTVWNVKGCGATGNGTTDDTSAINSCISQLNAAGGGVLYFPVGRYFSANCGFTLSTPTIVAGDGLNDSRAGVSGFGSTLVCNSPTATFFTVTATGATFRHLSMFNTSPTIPSAGAAIFTNSTYISQRVNYDDIQVYGFFDDVSVGVGAEWTMYRCEMFNFVRYGLHIQNTVNPDAGDWRVTGNQFVSGPSTEAVGSAGIFQETSGGGIIAGNKFNASPGGNAEHAMRFNLHGSVQLQIIGNNVETTSKEPIFFDNAWQWITITDNMLIAPIGFPDINVIEGANNMYIGGGTMNGLGTVPFAVVIGGVPINVIVMPFASNSFTTARSNLSTVPANGNFNNGELNAFNFNGSDVKAATGEFTTAATFGNTAGGGAWTLDGKVGINFNWTCSTSGGVVGMDCESAGGAGFRAKDDSSFDITNGPYEINGVAISTTSLSDGIQVLKDCGTLTTTAATSDPLSCSWVTTTSACSVTRNGTTDATFSFFTPSAGVVTINHAAVAGATYAVACSPQ